MKKQFVITLSAGVVIGVCLALGSRIFMAETTQAQCVQFYLASGATLPVDCGAGDRLSQVQSDSTRFTALCAQ